MTIFCVRADGTAPTKFGATGPISDPSKCMDHLVFNVSVFSSGDQVVFGSQGGKFRGAIIVPPTDEVEYTVDSDSVIINGAVILNNSSFIAAGGSFPNVYQKSSVVVAVDTDDMVWEETVALTPQSTLSAVEANPGSYMLDAGTLSIHPSDSSDLTTNGYIYEWPALEHCFADGGGVDMTISGFNIERSRSDPEKMGGMVVTGTRTIVDRIKSYQHSRHCFSFYTGANNCVATNLNLYDSDTTTAVAIFGLGTDDNLLDTATISDSFGQVICHGTSDGTKIPLRNTVKRIKCLPGGKSLENVLFVSTYVDGFTIDGCEYIGEHPGNDQIVHAALNSDNVKILNNNFRCTDVPLKYMLEIDSDDVIVNGNVIGSAQVYSPVINVNSPGSTITNNIFDAKWGVWYADAAAFAGATIDANHYFNCSRPGRIDATSYATLSDWQTATAQEVNASEGDPSFVGENGKISKASLCVNTGIRVVDVNNGIQEDPFKKMVYGLPNKGRDQGSGMPIAGQPKQLSIGGKRTFR